MRKIDQLSIDGIGVGLTKARFGDTFDVADGDENLLAFDEEVVYVVVARVSTPSFRESKSGEVSRVNVLKVKEARLVRSEQAKTDLLDLTRFDYRPQPSLFDTFEDVEELSDADLEAAGIKQLRQAPEPTEVQEDLEVYLAKIHEIADEYDEEENALGEVTEARRLAREAVGLGTIVAPLHDRVIHTPPPVTDPVLDKFLSGP